MMLGLLSIMFAIFASISSINFISMSRIDNSFKNIDAKMVSSCVYNHMFLGYVYDSNKIKNVVTNYLKDNLTDYVKEIYLNFIFYTEDKVETIIQNKKGIKIQLYCKLTFTEYKKAVTYFIGEY